MKNKILLTLVLLIPSLCFGESDRKVNLREALRVNDDHRTLCILVDGPMDKNAIDLHTVDIQKAIKLKMLTYAPNLKKFDTSSGEPLPHHVIWVKVEVMDVKTSSSVLGSAMYTEIYMQKSTGDYGIKKDYIGNVFRHNHSYSQMTMLSKGTGKSYALDVIKKLLDEFLLDYLEANTSESKKKTLDPNREYIFGREPSIDYEKLFKENN